MRRNLIAQAVRFAFAVCAFILHPLIQKPQLALLQIQSLLHLGDGVVQAAD